MTITTTLHDRPVTPQIAIRSLSRRHWRDAQLRQAITQAPRGTKQTLIDAIKRTYYARHRPRPAPLITRRNTRMIAKCNAEIRARALSTPAGWWDFDHLMSDYDPTARLWLVSGEGWFEYSRRHGRRYQSACYLCGYDDGQLFAVRVPATTQTVAGAIEWLTPREVRQARQRGLPTRRQGDLFFAPKRIPQHDMSALHGTRHAARPRKDGGLTIVHPEHQPIRLSARHTWRAYQSTQIDGNSRRCGD